MHVCVCIHVRAGPEYIDPSQWDQRPSLNVWDPRKGVCVSVYVCGYIYRERPSLNVCDHRKGECVYRESECEKESALARATHTHRERERERERETR